MNKFLAWVKQPSTINGISLFTATASGLVAHYLLHDTTLTATAAALGGAVVQVAIPDNSAAKTTTEKLVTDAVTALVQKKLTAAIPTLVSDALAVVGAVSAPASPIVTAAQPVPVITAATLPTFASATVTGSPVPAVQIMNAPAAQVPPAA